MARNRAVENRERALAGRDDVNSPETNTITEDTEPIDTDSPLSPGGEEKQVTVPERDRARVERALVHLEFLEKELKGLSEDKSSLAGAMRQTASQIKNQLTTNINQWQPIKVIRTLLEKVRDTLPTDEE